MEMTCKTCSRTELQVYDYECCTECDKVRCNKCVVEIETETREEPIRLCRLCRKKNNKAETKCSRVLYKVRESQHK